MMHPDDARSLLLDRAQPLATIACPLLQSVTHVLASAVCADRDIPPADRAAMDGYAVRFEDVKALPTVLQVVDEIPAGTHKNPQLTAGQCVRIFTGSVIPTDADTVIMQEHTESPEGKNSHVRIMERPKRGQHIFRQGENGKKGAVLIPAGTCINSLHVGICATVGASLLDVYRKPRTAVLTTGKELKGVGDAVEPHQIRDANGPVLEAALAAAGFAPDTAMRVDDDEGQIRDTVQALQAEHDVLLITGGVSVGKYDLVPGVVESIGGQVLYHGLEIKPGKPQLCAILPDGKLIFGLPGNPLSVLVGLYEFALPALKRLAGHPPEECYSTVHLPLMENVFSKGKRQHQQLARVIESAEGPRVKPIRHTGSSDLIAAGQAHGVLIVPQGIRELPKGHLVEFRAWIPHA